MKARQLDAKRNGEMDYDEEHDILFLKVKGREYDHSLELEDIVLDVDKEGLVTGIQIFDASGVLNVESSALKSIRSWEFKIRTEGKLVFVQVTLEILRGDRVVERGQNMVRETSSTLTESEVQCAMAV